MRYINSVLTNITLIVIQLCFHLSMFVFYKKNIHNLCSVLILVLCYSYKRQAKKVKKQESVWSGIFNYSAFVVGIGILATDRLVSFTSVTGRSMQVSLFQFIMFTKQKS